MLRIFISGNETEGIENEGVIVITGENANHISRSLRMRTGEKLIVCNGVDTEYFCTIESFTSDSVLMRVDEIKPGVNEPCYQATLFMALPKSDKMEQIIQKSVETGVSAIVPVVSSRCVSKPDERALHSKLERWRKIARSAAEQCGRVRIPQILPSVKFSEAAEMMSDTKRYDGAFICYECERENNIAEYLSVFRKNTPYKIAFMVGAEGGFSSEEISFTDSLKIKRVSLGKRILRCETAPVFVLSVMSALLD